MSEVSEVDLAAIEETLAAASKPAAPKAESGALRVFIDPVKLKDDLRYTEASINQATMDQASLFSYYAQQAARAAHQQDQAKNNLEVVEAQVDRRLRDEAAATGQKVTEAALSKAIVLDAEYQAAIKRYNEAKLITALCDQAREAFRQRMFMLIQTGKDQQIERQGDLRLTEVSSERRSALHAGMRGEAGY